MNREEYLKLQKETMDKVLEITKRKNQDYASSGDPFANIKAIESFGIKAEVGLITRMTDKLSRLSNLLNNEQKTSVQDESLEDTFMDLIGYSLLGIGLLRDKKPNEE